jgi:hypothetical protein
MIRDRECIYGAVVTRRLPMGIRDKPRRRGFLPGHRLEHTGGR